jgi:Uma2 family endonuclease
MAASAVPRFTHEEFIEFERESRFRHEYIRGHIELMAGGSENHALLILSIGAILRTALRGRDCRAYGSDLLVRIESADMSSYPDAMVICGPTHFAERRNLAVDNPVLLVEVLSPTTEGYDRNEKFPAYLQLGTLREVLFIAQDRPSVEYWKKQDDGWISAAVSGLDGVIDLQHLDVKISMGELYADVRLTS